MKRFSVPLHIEVEAEDQNAAFADVRNHFIVQRTNDSFGRLVLPAKDVPFVVEEPVQLREGEYVTE